MTNASQGNLKDGVFTTMTLIGRVSSSETNSNTGTLVIKGSGGISLDTGEIRTNGNVISNNIVQTEILKVTGGAVAGDILRARDSTGEVYWSPDLDNRIFGEFGGDINFQYGSFGIGISFPQDMLHVKDNIRTDSDLIFTNDSNISFPSLLTFNNNDIFFNNNPAIGIGITPSQPLDVIGNIKLSGDLIKNTETYELPTLGYNSDILVAVTKSQLLYNKTLDNPNVQGNLNMNNSGRIINVDNPIYLQDVATKDYVDTFIQGLDPQESVIDKDIQIPPSSPSNGDRYIVAIGATGTWAGQDNNIAQYENLTTSWNFIIPDQGTMTIVEDEFRKYIYNGSSWILFDTLTRHGDLQELLDDDHTQYQLLAGRNGGQTMHGGSEPNDDFTIYSNNHPTRGNIILQPDGGFVSIGTTNPSHLLHIHSQTNNNSSILLNTTDNNSNASIFLKTWEIKNNGSINNLVINDGNTDKFVIEQGISGAFKFYSGIDEWARLDAGFLGIGTTNPTERLSLGSPNSNNDEVLLIQSQKNTKISLNSNTNSSNNTDTSIIEFLTNNQSQQAIIGLVATNQQFAQNTHENALFLGAGASGVMTDIQFGTNDIVRMSILENGNVGINNDLPDAQLNINHSLGTHNGISLGSTNNISFKIGQNSSNHLNVSWNYNSTPNNAYSNITNENSLNDLILQSTGGLVGIGTTSPQDILDVNGNIRIAGTINRNTEIFNLPTNSDTLIGTTSNNLLHNKELNDNNVFFVNNLDNSKITNINLASATTSTKTTLNFIQTQNRTITFPDTDDILVGVSTTANISNKNLSGNIMTNLISGSGTVTFPPVSASGDSVVYFDQTQTLSNKTLDNPNVVGTLTQSSGGGIITDKLQAINNSGIAFLDSNGILAFSLSDGGLLGVGITQPSADLHVVGNTTKLDTNLSVNTDTLYVAVTSSRVGINTDNPLYDLHVAGNAKINSDLTIDGNLFVNGTQTVINSSIIAVQDSLSKYADGNVADTLDIGFYGCYVNTGITKMTGLFRDASDKKYKLFSELEISPNDNIVDVNGTGYTKAELVLGTINTDNLNHDNNLLINNTQGVFTSTGSLGILTTSPNETLHVNGTAQIGNELFVKNQNIGINNSSPVNKLDVNGSSKFNGNSSTTLTGTVNPNGTTTLNGSGTLFLTELVVGDKITIVGSGETRTVQSISSNTSLTVNSTLSNVATTTATRLPAISIFNNNSISSNVVITNEGFLGIDSNHITYPFQLEKQNNANWSSRINNGETTIFMAHADGLGMSINTGSVSDTSYSLKIQNNSNVLLRLQNDKKLGIGTDSPTELLHLQGNAVGDGARIANAKLGVWEGNTAYMALTHNDIHATSTSYALKQHNAGKTQLNSAATKDISFSINDVELMTLKPSGRVGIGTNNPSTALHVMGSSTITGNINIGGNLIVSGEMVEIAASEVVVQDSMIKLADGNTTDIIDSGIYIQYNNGTNRYSGLYRENLNKNWILFDNLSEEPGTTQVNNGDSSFQYANLTIADLDIYSNGTTSAITLYNSSDSPLTQIISDQNNFNIATSGTFLISSPTNTLFSVDQSGNVNFNNLQANNVRYNVSNITNNITINETYSYIIADATTNDIIITLPISHNTSNPDYIGLTFTIVKIDTSSNNVIIKTSGSDIIDGVYSQFVMNSQYDRIKITSIGGNSSIGIWITE